MQLLTASELQGHYGLFVGIVTSPDHFYNRHMARKTWLRYPKLRFFFMLTSLHDFCLKIILKRIFYIFKQSIFNII